MVTPLLTLSQSEQANTRAPCRMDSQWMETAFHSNPLPSNPNGCQLGYQCQEKRV
jgi:hypothetical protein